MADARAPEDHGDGGGRGNHQALIDALVIGGSTFLAFVFASHFGAFEAIGAFAEAHESWQLDEVITLLLLGGMASFVFGLRRYADLRRETSRRRRAEAEVHRLAYDDALTGLPNRRAFQLRLDNAIEQAGGAHSSFALMLFDLDHFRFVNDLHGHEAGDRLLVSVADRLRPVLLPDDMLARLGGDEFAVIARSAADSGEAARLAHRIIRAVSEPVVLDDRQMEVGASIGLALYPADGVAPESLLRRADIALYRAKQEGRGGSRFFEASMDQLIGERATMERALRVAIRENRIGVAFQSLFDLKTGSIVGFEALARWTDADLGEVPAAAFIQVAEDSGLITQLSDQLLRKACSEAVKWPPHVTLSFNISSTQLRDRLLGLRIVEILAETGLRPGRLEIEITESALVREQAVAHRMLEELRAAGIRVALDDFGTGYSNLAQLTRFKFDRIKIDRSFIGQLFGSGQQSTLVRAVLGLASGLGIATTAEGVESEGQLAFLRAEGCDLGQGFLFSKAVSGADALKLVAGQLAAGRRLAG